MGERDEHPRAPGTVFEAEAGRIMRAARARGRRRMRAQAREAGHTLLIVVLIIAVMMVGMTVAMKVWSTVIKREKEDELIFRGKQYAMAHLPVPQAARDASDGAEAAVRDGTRPDLHPAPAVEGPDHGAGLRHHHGGPEQHADPGRASRSTATPIRAASSGSGEPSETGVVFGNPSGTCAGRRVRRDGREAVRLGGTIGGVPQAGQTTTGGLPIMGVHSKSRDEGPGPRQVARPRAATTSGSFS